MAGCDLVSRLRLSFESLEKDTGIPLSLFPYGMRDLVCDILHSENFMPSYLVFSMISAISSAAGNSVQLHVSGSWFASCSLYMVLVGRSGVGKTPPMSYAYQPLFDSDNRKRAEFIQKLREYRKSGQESASGRPVLEKTIHNDYTQEGLAKAHANNPRGITIYADELMAIFKNAGRYSSSNSAVEFLLSSFNNVQNDITRADDDRSYHIGKPCVNLIGGIQTDMIGNLFCDEYRHNGLLGRLLFVYPDDQRVRKLRLDLEENRKASEKWRAMVERILSLECRYDRISLDVSPMAIGWTEEARSLYEQWDNDIVDRLNSLLSCDPQRPLLSKERDRMPRLILVSHLIFYACDETGLEKVQKEAVAMALGLEECFSRSYWRLEDYFASDYPKGWEPLIRALPAEFTTGEAVQIGSGFNMAERTVKLALRNLQAGHYPVIRKISFGKYRRME